MSKSAIEEKLRRELISPEPLTELRVVYILVEVRKLIQRQYEMDVYETLCFYCDWAVHAHLSRRRAQDVLRLFDDAHPRLCRDEALPRELDKAIKNLTDLQLLKHDLDKFLNASSLPTESVIHAHWSEFVRSYAAVIEDCPLLVSANHLRNLKSVTVTVEDANRDLEGYKLFRVVWNCLGQDGSKGAHEVYMTIPLQEPELDSGRK